MLFSQQTRPIPQEICIANVSCKVAVQTCLSQQTRLCCTVVNPTLRQNCCSRVTDKNSGTAASATSSAVSKVTSFWTVGFGDGYARENVLPPANIHTALHSLLQGQPQPALLPLLASKQAPCVQRTCDMLELYTLLNESTAACSRILAQSSMTQADDSASRVGFQSAAFRHDSAHADLARSALQEGAQKLVLAMVDRVRSPAHVANLDGMWRVGTFRCGRTPCCCSHSACQEPGALQHLTLPRCETVVRS